VTNALVYLKLTSFKNLLRSRLRQLRKPQYLVGLLVSVLYFGSLFFARSLGHASPSPSVAMGDGESFAATMVLLFLALSWIFPSDRASLAFTEPEVAFLFAAPMSRRSLLHYKIITSQLQILFSILIILLLSGGATDSKRWIHLIGWWFILTTLRLHALGASFLRTLLLDRGFSNNLRRVVVLTLLAGVLGAAWWTRAPPAEHLNTHLSDLVRAFGGPRPTRALPAEIPGEASWLELQSFWSSFEQTWLLAPCRWVVRPYLAADFAQWWRASIPALLILIVLYLWILRADVAFEDASIDQARRVAERLAALRSGRGLRPQHRSRRPLFTLAGRGPVPLGLLWKNLFSALSDVRLLTRLSPFIIGGALIGSRFGQGGAVTFSIAITMLFFSFLVGPQFLRADLRSDLESFDQLKTLPVRGWQIVLGELLAPVLLMSFFQWVLLAAAFLSFPSTRHHDLLALKWEVTSAIALTAPSLNLMLFLIPNAGALIFPAWHNTSRTGPGLELAGQRMLILIGSMVVLFFALLPVAVVSGTTYFVCHLLSPRIVAVPITALVTSLALAVEGALGIVLLGLRFEGFDLSTELRS
jgi:hypothetical protein